MMQCKIIQHSNTYTKGAHLGTLEIYTYRQKGAVLYYFAHNSKTVSLHIIHFYYYVSYTCWMRPNKVETGRRLLTDCNGLLHGTV